MEAIRTPQDEIERVVSEVLLPRVAAWGKETLGSRPLGLTPELCLKFGRPYAVTLAWVGLMSSPAPTPYHEAVVRRAFAREGIKDPSPVEVARVAAALLSELPALFCALSLESFSVSDFLEPPQEDGMFVLDARAARYLATRDGQSEGSLALAQLIQTGAKERWENYTTATEEAPLSRRALLCESLWSLYANRSLQEEGLPALAVAVLLARALVKELRVAPPQNEQADAKGPSAPVPKVDPTRETAKEAPLAPPEPKTVATFHLEIFRTYSGFSNPKEVSLSPDFTQVLRGGEVLADVATLPKNDLLLLQRGMHTFGKLLFRRTVNYFVRACWERHQAGEARPEVLTFQGPKHLAECLGELSHESQADLVPVLLQGQHFSLSWPGGYIGGLWTFFYQRACRGRKAWVEVQLARILQPHYGMGILSSPWRVPVVKLGPFVGRHNEHAAQAAFQELFLLALAERRLELVKEGGARLTEEELGRLAKEASLPKETLPLLLDRWTRTEEDGEAFLSRTGDRFLLADTKTYGGAREFLLEAGRRSLASREAAQRGIRIQHLHRRPKKPK